MRAKAQTRIKCFMMFACVILGGLCLLAAGCGTTPAAGVSLAASGAAPKADTMVGETVSALPAPASGEPVASVTSVELEGMVASEASEVSVELMVSAASSMTDAMEELAELYVAGHPDVRIVLNFGSSGSLRKQIEEGAPADVFFSASDLHMNALETQGLLDVPTRRDLLGNRLVMVIPVEGTLEPSPEADPEQMLRGFLASPDLLHVAMGDPDSVPAGTYAREALTALGSFDDLASRLTYAKNVREVLAWVETGNAEAGFVFRTDALSTDKVREVIALPEDWTGPIRYPLAALSGSRHPEAAADLVAWLAGPDAWPVFEAAGFMQSED